MLLVGPRKQQNAVRNDSLTLCAVCRPTVLQLMGALYMGNKPLVHSDHK